MKLSALLDDVGMSSRGASLTPGRNVGESAAGAVALLDASSDASGMFAKVSSYVDTASTAADAVESSWKSAQMLGDDIGSLGEALKSLEQIIKIVDGIVEVSTDSKDMWVSDTGQL
jgi:hypothetical protein